MKKVFLFTLMLVSMASIFCSEIAWNLVEEPKITEVVASGRKISAMFTMVTGDEGADKLEAFLFDEQGNQLQAKTLGKSKKADRKVDFTMAKSGDYSVKISAIRNDETTKLESNAFNFNYVLPLDAPQVSATNAGGNVMDVTWQAVDEAQSYTLKVSEFDTGKVVLEKEVQNGLEKVSSLESGKAFSFEITAHRGQESVGSVPLKKTAQADKDRKWDFTYFGQSSKESLNKFQMLDSDDLKFTLATCTFDSVGNTVEKGGKFTAYHDGISFYYTQVDAAKENFVLTATFTVDYINPSADGQEGFGLIVMDSLGEHGVNGVNHYTNSAAIIATKFEETIDGTKKTSKDALGARFVTGLTPEVLAGGDAAIAEFGTSVGHAYSYDQSDLVRKGDVYRITLKKTNTGYHCIFDRAIPSEETITEYVLYGPEKLLQLDSEHVYVGFAAARGCNVTVSDVDFEVTNPALDPPAEEEPPQLVPLWAKVDSPSTYPETEYPFVFCANADGKLRLKTIYGNVVLDNVPVKALEDYKKTLTLKKGINDFIITFTPDPSYQPGDNQVMASYNDELKRYEKDYNPVNINYSVSCLSYPGDTLYVSPNGSPFGKGTEKDPLDLGFAISYAKPGQTIIMAGGVYRLTRALIIDRGNNGPKTLQSAEGERAIFDFSGSTSGGIQLWGDNWVLKNFDIRNTMGNIKGLQIAGDYNVVDGVAAYNCGDTGIQISGTSNETWEKWPHDNLVVNCISHDNCDPAENNADGFAAKLTCGANNVFRNCIAFSNIDDGWDLFTKIESGPIGAVLIEDCVAYRNGSLSDGSGNGDGNGFKLGGDGIAVEHVINNCIAFSNGTSGITSNSNPAIEVKACTLFNNGTYNLTLYGKGSSERLFKVENVLSMEAPFSDNIKEQPELASENNWLNNGAVAVNSLGQTMGPEVFKNTNIKTEITRNADGTINMNGLLEQNTAFGAHLN